MKSKRFWFRVFIISGLSGIALAGLIAASPTLISDWIFRTGQHTFTVYNSSTQAIESVDNRNKGRRQYGPLSVDGALYANSTINATGAINIGADVSLTRSAADVLTTADSIISATHSVYGDLHIGNDKSQKLVFDNPSNYKILNAASYSNIHTGYTGMLKITIPINLDVAGYYMVNITVRGSTYAMGDWKVYLTPYWSISSYVNSRCQSEGTCPIRKVRFGKENGKMVVILNDTTIPLGNTQISIDLETFYYAVNADNVLYENTYSITEVSDISGVSNIVTVDNSTSIPKIFTNGVVVGTNKAALTSGYVLDVSGAAYVSGTIYGAGNISGLSFTDRTPGSPEDALKEISAWKVTGEEIDHNSLGESAVDITEVKTGFEVVDKAGNIFNSIDEKVIPTNGSKETNIQLLSEAVEKVKEDIAEVSADYQVREVTKVVETKGRDLSKTVSILSRAIQQLSERLDKLEGR